MLKLNNSNTISIIITVGLLFVITILVFLNLSDNPAFYIEINDNVLFYEDTNTIELDSLTLRQKIAQMVIVYGKEDNKEEFQKMMAGGVYLETKPNKKEFIRSINRFQSESVVPFFITVDLEGCHNPFENFQEFPTFKEIKTVEEAYNVGLEEGQFLQELGFNMNFAPVVDLEDTIWGCRSFEGTPEEVAAKANSYINGMSTYGIITVAKHYPGKTLIMGDSHVGEVEAEISEDDLLPFRSTIDNGVPAIMVSHLVAGGSVDSEFKPSVVSSNLVSGLRDEFTGLIITDEIGMEGLRSFYSTSSGTDYGQMFLDLFKADNDIVITFDRNPVNVYEMVKHIEKAVERGEISEERIDTSVIKILEAKGITVI